MQVEAIEGARLRRVKAILEKYRQFSREVRRFKASLGDIREIRPIW
jgi:hypothetical protein